MSVAKFGKTDKRLRFAAESYDFVACWGFELEESGGNGDVALFGSEGVGHRGAVLAGDRYHCQATVGFGVELYVFVGGFLILGEGADLPLRAGLRVFEAIEVAGEVEFAEEEG